MYLESNHEFLQEKTRKAIKTSSQSGTLAQFGTVQKWLVPKSVHRLLQIE